METYVHNPARDLISFRFEDYKPEHQQPDPDYQTEQRRKGMASLEWRKWWDAKPTEQEQVVRVQKYKQSADSALDMESKQTFVDLGHHNVQGMLQVIPAVFGDDAFLLRVRRNRLDTAFSFKESKADMCEAEFRICPLTNNCILEPPGSNWSASLWHSFSVEQQAFWFIDEIEAQWQRLLLRYPDVSYAECDWSGSLAPCLYAVAAVMGLDVPQKSDILRNHTGSDVPNYETLAAEDLEYHRRMSIVP
jgi:hypothetical protein